MVAHRDERPFGKVVKHMFVVYLEFYIQVVEQSAHKFRPGSGGVVCMDIVDLVERQEFDEPVHELAMPPQFRHHLHDIVGIEHGKLPWLAVVGVHQFLVFIIGTRLHLAAVIRILNCLHKLKIKCNYLALCKITNLKRFFRNFARTP